MGAASRSAAAFVLTDARGAQQPEAAQPEPPGLARGRRMRGVVIAIGVGVNGEFYWDRRLGWRRCCRLDGTTPRAADLVPK